MTVTELVIGILILCFELEPDVNGAVQTALIGFVCFFSLRQFAGAFRRLRGTLRRSPAAILIAGGILAVLLSGQPAWQAFLGVLGVVLALGLTASIVALVGDSGWYFALLEDYRDRYVWHSHPHPDIFFTHKDK